METKRSAVMTVIRVTSGNFLEMLDFFLFGLFAAPIGKAFFPIEDDVGRLLLTFVTFGAGFLMRPLGALVLGAYIDRVGRRKGLVTTLAIMALGTVLIAMTPGYRWFQSISPSLIYVAPAIVLIGRLAQGFSAGVELGGVSVYLSEIATPGHKGFYASWQSGSQQVAVMVGALLVFFVNKSMPAAQVESWGWRIPFFIGCIIVPLIFVIRRNLQETESFLKQKRHPTGSEIIRTVLSNSRIVILGMLLVVMTTVSFYLITIYTPTFGKQTLKLASTDALVVTFAVGLSNFFWLPVMGALSDAIGRKPLLLTFTALAVLTVYPAMLWLVDGPTFTKMLIVELWLSFLYASYNGALVVALTEIVPPSVRTSGFSLAYSLATAIFGGFTPAISEWLIGFTADKAAPGLWMSAAAAISFVAAVLVFRSKPVYVEEQGHALAAH